MKTLTSTKQKMLLVLIDEADNWGDQHLYEAIAETWSVCSVTPGESHLAVIDEGIQGGGRQGVDGVRPDQLLDVEDVAVGLVLGAGRGPQQPLRLRAGWCGFASIDTLYRVALRVVV